jgi:hypothetical protein
MFRSPSDHPQAVYIKQAHIIHILVWGKPPDDDDDDVKKSKHVGVFVDYMWKYTFSYLYICWYYPLNYSLMHGYERYSES